MPKNKNIILQEEEFLKLNAEIDSKTKDLLSQVDQIKELQVDNEKQFSAWEKESTSFEIINHEENKSPKEKNQNEFNTSLSSSEVNYALSNYLSKINTSSDLVFLSNGEIFQNTEIKRNKFRKNQKLSQSAKVSASLSTTILGENLELPFEGTTNTSNGKLGPLLDNNIIPETLKDAGQEGINRFLTAKVKALTEQLQVLQKDGKKHAEKIKELQIENNNLVEQREKLNHQANLSRNNLIKLEQQLTNMSAQLKNAQAENSNLKKELENVKKEMKDNSKNHNANELRLNRTLEEVEKLKSTIHQMKQEEKELRESHRKRTEELSSSVKKLDRQKIELLNGFKKQLLIIDNLKKQKGLMDANKLLKCTEEDFINFLDCNPPNAKS